jgi:flagellar biosynthesis/type III secretory pathway protein FliH
MDVFQIVVEDTRHLVGEKKRKDSDVVLARIKKVLMENRDRELEYSMFDHD